MYISIYQARTGVEDTNMHMINCPYICSTNVFLKVELSVTCQDEEIVENTTDMIRV